MDKITTLQFCYMLQGFAEIFDEVPNKDQWLGIEVLVDTVDTKLKISESSKGSMTSDQFYFWLKGFIDITDVEDTIKDIQWTIIKDHLAVVFTKVTPDRKEEKKPDNEFDPEQLKKIFEELREKPVLPILRPKMPDIICGSSFAPADIRDTKFCCSSGAHIDPTELAGS